MDTAYYSFETRKIKVSGGADMLTVVPTAMPAPASPAGEVLDFERCRRRLETKAAWKCLAQAAESAETPMGPWGAQVCGGAAPVSPAAAFGTAPAAPRSPAPGNVPAKKRPGAARAVASKASALASKASALADKLCGAARALRAGRVGGWLELLSSVAMLLVCVYVGWAFLALA